MPSSAFRSGSQQRHKGAHSDTPGVGSYRPKREAVEPNTRNVGHGMRAKDERFKYDKPPTDDNVGPGLYDYGTFMSTELERSLTKTSKGGSAFGTKTAQRALPHDASMVDNPGPGSYDQFEKTLAEDCDLAIQRSSRIKPGFGTSTPQRALPFYAQGTPAPGSYEPMEPRLNDLTGEARRQVM